jgi:mannose-6-phosphate isomerase-like protein (cupin superfamily)
MGPDDVAPDGSEIRFKVGDAERASLVEVRLGPGMTTRPVRHRTVEEIWYFVAGRGRVWLQRPGAVGETMSVGPGDAVQIPTGWAFQFAAEADEELRFACFTSPPWPGPEEAVPVEQGGLGPPTV